MKKLILAFLLLLNINCFAQSDSGISFTTGTKWADLLAKAKSENKLLFVDVYTVWCVPCKTMDKQIFPMPQVGAFFNQSFINVKLDAEKSEGLLLAKKYHVASYPNFLFINGDGVLIYRAGGSMAAPEFIKNAKNAIAESKQGQTIVELEALYPSHKGDKDFMFNYLSRLTALRLPIADLLDQYIGRLSNAEQAEPKNIKLIADNATFVNRHLQLGISLEVLKRNLNVYDELKAKKSITNMPLGSIDDIAREVSLKKAIENKDEKLLALVESTEKDAHEAPFDNKLTVALDYYWNTQNYPKYKSTATKYINEYLLKIPKDTLDKWDMEVYNTEKQEIEKQNNPQDNNPAVIYEYRRTQTIHVTNTLADISDKMLSIPLTAAELNQVTLWTRKATEIADTDQQFFKNANPGYRRTYALALYKSNNKREAIKIMADVVNGLPANETTQEHFGSLLAKMKANQKL